MRYLYNGVGPLPDIYSVYTPELQETHPCAVIVKNSAGTVVKLGLFTGTPNITDNGSLYGAITESDSLEYEIVDGVWAYSGQFFLLANIAIWTNKPLRSEGGIFYLAASDPIPVLNPTAILMGYSMGAKL